MKKKTISLILALFMLLSALPIAGIGSLSLLPQKEADAITLPDGSDYGGAEAKTYVAYDFEDRTENGTVVSAEDYYIESKDNPDGILSTSNYGRGGKESIEIASAENGDPVISGSHSLKLNYDFSETESTEGACISTKESVSIPGRPVAIGMWVYAPEGVGVDWPNVEDEDGDPLCGLWLRHYLYDGDGNRYEFDFTFEPNQLGDLPEGTLPGIYWEGWKYVEADISEYPDPFSFEPGNLLRLMYVPGINMVGTQDAGSIYIDNVQFVYEKPFTVYDFEDKTVGDSVISAKDYYIESEDNPDGILSTSNYGRGGKGSIEIASAENGAPVKSGAHSLKLNFDFSECGATEAVRLNTKDSITVPGDPIGLGMWVYAPEGVGVDWPNVEDEDGDPLCGLWLRHYLYDGDGNRYEFNFTFEPNQLGDLPEGTLPGIYWEGWKYVEADISKYPDPFSFEPGNLLRLMYVPGINMVGTQRTGCIYIDDIQFIYEPVCEHSKMNKIDAVAATCLTPGRNAYYCCSACGMNFKDQSGTEETTAEKETIAALGHDIVKDEAVSATCTATGLTEGEHCSRCDYKVEQTVTEKLGHDIVKDEAVSATCTATGLTEGEHCSRCDYKVEQTVTEKLGHDVVKDEAVPATCTATGLTEGEHCSRCDYKVEQTVTEKLGHDIVKDEAVPATCTATGLAEGEHCSRCDYKVEQTVTEKLGHEFRDYTYNNDASCLADGTETAACIRCTETDTRTAAGTKLDHSFTGKAHDNGDGTHSFVCVNGCNEYGAPEAHTGMDDGVCDICGSKAPEDPTEPADPTDPTDPDVPEESKYPVCNDHVTGLCKVYNRFIAVPGLNTIFYLVHLLTHIIKGIF